MDNSIQRMATMDWRRWLWVAQGGSQLALHAAAEVTEIVQGMHGTITQVPMPLGKTSVSPLANAPLPYRLVAGALRYVAKSLGRFAIHHDVQQAEGAWLPLLSAINGVSGDKLAAWQSPWALTMTLRDKHGQAIAWGELAPTSSARVLLFIHGLCLSEREWQTPVHQAYVELLESKGWRVAYLRYNSGLSIAENGANLSSWLAEALAHYPVADLRLIGHSMGGLLIRSAFVHELSVNWLSSVSGAAYLGTPHHGAPLERAGHWLQSLLASSPYVLPLTRLGDIRSVSIKELRYAYVHAHEAEAGRYSGDDHRQAELSLPDGLSHVLLAGRCQMAETMPWLGDGLVPLSSALGYHPDPNLNIRAARLQRHEWPQLGHLELLGDERVWNTLTDWIVSSGRD